MKEATNALNMTLVTIISIGIFATFFYTIIWPTIKNNFNSSIKCNAAICNSNVSNGQVSCRYTDNNGNTVNMTCVYKG